MMVHGVLTKVMALSRMDFEAGELRFNHQTIDMLCALLLSESALSISIAGVLGGVGVC